MPTAVRLILCFSILTAGCASAAEAPPAADPPATTATATGSPSPTAGGGTPPAGEVAVPAVYVALCDATTATDPAAAKDAFGRAHDGLHTLARELQDTDERAAAGDLLEAKQRVEAAFADVTVPDDLDQRLDRLLTATADAIVASGQPRPTCPEGSTP